MGVWGQNRGIGGAILTPNELILLLGGSYVCANFGENRSRKYATVRVPQYTQRIYATARDKCALEIRQKRRCNCCSP